MLAAGACLALSLHGGVAHHDAAITPGGDGAASPQALSTTVASVQRVEDIALHTGSLRQYENGNKISSEDFFVRIVSYHKGGSGMARDGVDALTVRAKDLLQSGVLMAAPHAEPDVRVGYFAVAANGVDLGLVGADDGGYAPFYGYPRCPRPANFTKVFSISRNPFEITVSEMAYDVDGGEVYGNQIPSSIWGDATACSVTSGKSIPQYCDGLQQVSVAMRSYLKGVLPPPSSTLTTWHEYLVELLDGGSEDEALLATAIFMRQVTSDAQVQFLRYQAAVLPKSGVSCEAEYDDADLPGCTRVWRRMLETLVVDGADADAPPSIAGVALGKVNPWGGDFGGLVDELAEVGANASCPVANPEAVSNHGTDDVKNETEGADRVVRLRRLDAQYLNGSLAALEVATGCACSERYLL